MLIRIKGSGAAALEEAFLYAAEHSPSARLTGTITVYGVSYGPVISDGPSVGAVVAVGFLGLFQGDSLIPGIAMTGTLHRDGRIAPVGSIPDKVRAALCEGCRTVLTPQGQRSGPRWNLRGLAFSSMSRSRKSEPSAKR